VEKRMTRWRQKSNDEGKVMKKQRRSKESDMRESNSYDLWRRLKIQRAAKSPLCQESSAFFVRHWRRLKE
jgi:hypothetical protein